MDKLLETIEKHLCHYKADPMVRCPNYGRRQVTIFYADGRHMKTVLAWECDQHSR